MLIIVRLKKNIMYDAPLGHCFNRPRIGVIDMIVDYILNDSTSNNSISMAECKTAVSSTANALEILQSYTKTLIHIYLLYMILSLTLVNTVSLAYNMYTPVYDLDTTVLYATLRYIIKLLAGIM